MKLKFSLTLQTFIGKKWIDFITKIGIPKTGIRKNLRNFARLPDLQETFRLGNFVSARFSKTLALGNFARLPDFQESVGLGNFVMMPDLKKSLG